MAQLQAANNGNGASARHTKHSQVWSFAARYSIPKVERVTEEGRRSWTEAAKLRVKEAIESTCDRWIYQLEATDTEDGPQTNIHFQIYCHIKDKTRPATLGSRWCEAYGLDGVNVTAASTAGKEQLRLYCMKDDTRIDGPWTDGRSVPYMMKDLQQISAKRFPSQEQILQMVKQEPDDRSVIAIVNPKGNAGKSKLVKYCRMKKMVWTVPFGTATQLKTAVIAHGAERAYFVDVPRTLGREDSLADMYSTIEELKNGNVSSGMYGKDGELLMEPPHVIVFSNQIPDTYLISADRWKFYYLHDRDHKLMLIRDGSEELYLGDRDFQAKARRVQQLLVELKKYERSRLKGKKRRRDEDEDDEEDDNPTERIHAELAELASGWKVHDDDASVDNVDAAPSAASDAEAEESFAALSVAESEDS